MRNLLRDTWIWFCNLMKNSTGMYSFIESILLQFSPPTGPHQNETSLRDKSIAVAGRVTTAKDTGSSYVSCPVCLNVLRTQGDADLTMMLAVHLSLWHPDDVVLQWDIIQKKRQPIVHLPSLIIGVGMAAAFGALLAISAKNRAQQLPFKVKR